MVHLLVSPSPLLVAGEVVLGLSFPMFVEGMILAFGHRLRLNAGR